jgi:amidohydrolase
MQSIQAPGTADTDRTGTEDAALTIPGTRAALTEGAAPGPFGATKLPEPAESWLARSAGELVAIRRHLHAHPELSGQEFATAALVAAELTAAGLTPRLLPNGNGVFCDIGEGENVVALRADLDALPLPDLKDTPYRSRVAGVCHACGHDVHTTVVLGTGLALAQLAEQGQLPGRVRLIFQPAEESIPSGAPEMIAVGGLKDVSAIYALHCYPQLPVGQVGVRPGPFTAAADKVAVRVSGPGGHTARPHLTADVVQALARVIVDVPALLARRVDPRAGVTMTFGSVHAGEAANAIPGEGTTVGCVRTLNRDVWERLPCLVNELIRSAVAGTGAEVDVAYTRGVPLVVNDARASTMIATGCAAALGPDQVVEAETSMGGEDFSFYLDQVPGAMVRLGVGVPGAANADLHTSRFDVDERAIGYGVRVLVHTALTALTADHPDR